MPDLYQNFSLANYDLVSVISFIIFVFFGVLDGLSKKLMLYLPEVLLAI